MNTQKKGNIAEARAVTRLTELGYRVYTAFGEGETPDMVVIKGEKVLKVEVKSASVRDDRDDRDDYVIAYITRTNMTAQGHQKKFYTSDEVDVFLVYDSGGDRLFWVPFEDSPKRSITIKTDGNTRYGGLDGAEYEI